MLICQKNPSSYISNPIKVSFFSFPSFSMVNREAKINKNLQSCVVFCKTTTWLSSFSTFFTVKNKNKNLSFAVEFKTIEMLVIKSLLSKSFEFQFSSHKSVWVLKLFVKIKYGIVRRSNKFSATCLVRKFNRQSQRRLGISKTTKKDCFFFFHSRTNGRSYLFAGDRFLCKLMIFQSCFSAKVGSLSRCSFTLRVERMSFKSYWCLKFDKINLAWSLFGSVFEINGAVKALKMIFEQCTRNCPSSLIWHSGSVVAFTELISH